MTKISLYIITIILTFSVVSQSAYGSENGEAMLVLDASGSMWGQINGRTKIEIAREVLGSTVDAWDEGQSLGLVAYGHNRKGDCSDIELLIEPAQVDAEKFSAVASNLNPKGKTPLSAAVKKAAEGMVYTENKATVILISDGKETCNLDPCEVGRSLEQSGVDFTAHIIGFDVSEEDSIGMKCLAKETGGTYIDAKDADQLKNALDQTRDVVTDTASVVTTPASVNVPVEVIAGAAFSAEWKGPKNASDYLEIRSENNTGSYGVAYIAHQNNQSPVTLTAPEEAGTYFVHYSLKDKTSLASDQLLVITPEATLTAPESVIAGQSFEVEWTGPKNEFDSIRIFTEEGESMHSYSVLKNDQFLSPATLTAPVEVGNYVIEYRTLSKNTLASVPIIVTEALATVSAPKQVVMGAPFDVKWTGPRNQYDRIRILDASGKRLQNSVFVERESVPNIISMSIPLDPGEYIVAYDAASENVIAQTVITVTPVVAMVSSPPVVAPGEEYQVEWYGPNYKEDSIYTFSMEGKDMREYTFLGKESSTSPVILNAPNEPGNYELRYMIEGRKVIATHTFSVR